MAGLQGEEPAPTGAGPARGYSRPAFQAGHTVSLRHGAYSKRVTDPLVEEKIEGQLRLAEQDPVRWGYLADPGYREELEDWALTEVMKETFRAEVARQGVFDEEGNSRPAEAGLSRWTTAAGNRREALGKNPKAHARLRRDQEAARRNVTPARIEEIQARLIASHQAAVDVEEQQRAKPSEAEA